MRALVFTLVMAACSPDGRGPLVVRASHLPIQGGTVDQTDSSVVAILVNWQGLSICTGTLIAPNLVLTAHHCVADSGDNTACGASPFNTPYGGSAFAISTSYNAAAQAWNANNFPSTDGRNWYGVSKVSVSGGDICGGDMSLLELTTPIEGTCPIVPRVDQRALRGEPFRAVGFGSLSPRDQSAGTRYQANLAVTCASNCASDDSPDEWEGGANNGMGTCEGDSGGPAIDSMGRLLGTVSRGPANSCDSTVYESVFAQSAWLKQQAMAAAMDGNYPPAPWVTGAGTGSGSSCGMGGSGGVDGGMGGGRADAAVVPDARGQGGSRGMDGASGAGGSPMPIDAASVSVDASSPGNERPPRSPSSGNSAQDETHSNSGCALRQYGESRSVCLLLLGFFLLRRRARR